MSFVVPIVLGLLVYYFLYKVLFFSGDDCTDQLKSFLAWLPITVLTDYDFSDSTWRIIFWLPSGVLVAALSYSLLR